MANDRVALLRGFTLWESFSDELLEVVGEVMEPVSYEPGEPIIRRGEPGRQLSVMVSGRADVRVLTQAGNVVTVSSMKAGDSFGEMSLLSEDPTSADVVATERCETLALGREAFHGLISGNPVLLREFVRLLSRRVKAADVAVGVARQKEEDLKRFLNERDSESCSVLVGKSKAMRDLQKQVEAKSALGTPLLIRGEKGTGKKLVARLVHSRGPRKDAPMVTVDCAQLAENPWGDPLFGLLDPSVTANARDLSYLALADGGTILLENVHVLPPAIQERLVRFLAGEAPAGGSRPDVRVVATCRGNLLEEAAAGRFSPELAAVLLGDVVELPTLREHKRDIPELASHFARKHAHRLGRKAPALDDPTMIRLVSYDYGFANVRELEESVARAVVLSDGDTVNPDAVFLGPPPREQPRGFNLLRLPKPLVTLGLRFFPSGIRAIATVAFAVILFGCFAVGGGPRGNFATVLVWAVWWPALVVSFFFAARAWCAICPMALSGEVAQGLVRRLTKVERSVPAWLRNNDVHFGMAGFFLIVWVEEVTHMRTSPVAHRLPPARHHLGRARHRCDPAEAVVVPAPLPDGRLRRALLHVLGPRAAAHAGHLLGQVQGPRLLQGRRDRRRLPDVPARHVRRLEQGLRPLPELRPPLPERLAAAEPPDSRAGDLDHDDGPPAGRELRRPAARPPPRPGGHPGPRGLRGRVAVRDRVLRGPPAPPRHRDPRLLDRARAGHPPAGVPAGRQGRGPGPPDAALAAGDGVGADGRRGVRRLPARQHPRLREAPADARRPRPLGHPPHPPGSPGGHPRSRARRHRRRALEDPAPGSGGRRFPLVPRPDRRAPLRHLLRRGPPPRDGPVGGPVRPGDFRLLSRPPRPVAAAVLDEEPRELPGRCAFVRYAEDLNV